MKILVVREIKIFFLLFFSYINKNLSCDCCDECWKKIFPDKKHLSKYSDKTKKSNSLSIIDEKKEEEENKEEKEEEENKDYLESLLEDINNIRLLESDFLKEKKDIYKGGGNLGEGSFGSVYKIQKINNGKFFALKQIVVEDNNDLKEIQKEIQNMILLRNEKNIVKIFDVYKEERNSEVVFYIIMEFCKNVDLYKPIFKKDIEIKEKDKLAYQLINAVRSCHKENIAHRDLKPKNIFLDKDWNVKLGDFGLSDIFEYDEKDGKDGLRVGSIRYMCYEKIQRKGHNPFKADLYSLGVILYELYTEIAYSKDEPKKFIHKNDKEVLDGYEDYVYTNEHVKDKLDENLDDENYYNLKILLTGLLKQLEVDRWDWKKILKSGFYKELQKKYQGN